MGLVSFINVVMKIGNLHVLSLMFLVKVLVACFWAMTG